MTVNVPQGDTNAAQLQSNITALQTQITNTKSTAHAPSQAARLDQLQRELVYHYLNTGRLTAANILAANL